jgi:hypothetical protein
MIRRIESGNPATSAVLVGAAPASAPTVSRLVKPALAWYSRRSDEVCDSSAVDRVRSRNFRARGLGVGHCHSLRPFAARASGADCSAALGVAAHVVLAGLLRRLEFVLRGRVGATRVPDMLCDGTGGNSGLDAASPKTEPRRIHSAMRRALELWPVVRDGASSWPQVDVQPIRIVTGGSGSRITADSDVNRARLDERRNDARAAVARRGPAVDGPIRARLPTTFLT